MSKCFSKTENIIDIVENILAVPGKSFFLHKCEKNSYYLKREF